MNKYEITLTAQYEKTVTVYAETPAHAREKIETILFDTDLIDFTDDDFVCGEVNICDVNECEYCGNIPDPDDEPLPECSACAYACPRCGACMCEDEE